MVPPITSLITTVYFSGICTSWTITSYRLFLCLFTSARTRPTIRPITSLITAVNYSGICTSWTITGDRLFLFLFTSSRTWSNVSPITLLITAVYFFGICTSWTITYNRLFLCLFTSARTRSTVRPITHLVTAVFCFLCGLCSIYNGSYVSLFTLDTTSTNFCPFTNIFTVSSASLNTRWTVTSCCLLLWFSTDCITFRCVGPITFLVTTCHFLGLHLIWTPTNFVFFIGLGVYGHTIGPTSSRFKCPVIILYTTLFWGTRVFRLLVTIWIFTRFTSILCNGRYIKSALYVRLNTTRFIGLWITPLRPWPFAVYWTWVTDTFSPFNEILAVFGIRSNIVKLFHTLFTTFNLRGTSYHTP